LLPLGFSRFPGGKRNHLLTETWSFAITTCDRDISVDGSSHPQTCATIHDLPCWHGHRRSTVVKGGKALRFPQYRNSLCSETSTAYTRPLAAISKKPTDRQTFPRSTILPRKSRTRPDPGPDRRRRVIGGCESVVVGSWSKGRSAEGSLLDRLVVQAGASRPHSHARRL
jgi:hypothetical protein